jgi:hypothetical protein
MDEQKARKQVRRERDFYGHLASYLIFMAFFATLNLLTSPGKMWFIFPMLGWGVGIAAHAASVFGFPGRRRDWEERRLRELMGEEGSASRLRSLVDEEFSRRTSRVRAGDSAAEAERLRERVEHLEAIVTSQDWDVLDAPAPAPAARMVDVPDEPDETAEERAARLAKRVR